MPKLKLKQNAKQPKQTNHNRLATGTKTTNMKYVFSIIGLVAGLVLGAQAQDFQSIFGGTDQMAASTGTITNTASAQKGTQINLQLAFKLTGAGTSGVGIVMDASNDGSVWSTTSQTFWLAANGTTAVNMSTNLTIGATPLVRFRAYNTNASIVTNITFTACNKWGS